jgi:carboxypeptidase PM20D1
MNLSPLAIAGIALGAILIILILVILFRTFSFPIQRDKAAPIALPEVDGKSVAERIGLAVQYKTIADPDPAKIDGYPFEGMHRMLRMLYPQVHEKLTLETVNQYSLLYTWEGNNPDLEPILFMAHQDVVPADESADSGWTHPPFSGELADGYVWGRGTLDIKNSLISLFEAVTFLLKEGFKPERTIYLAFGHDEEVSGIHGAKAIAELLESRGVRLSFLLDEGGSVMQGNLPGIEQPVALIGISEKGYLSLKLNSRVAGGHSSMPPENTAIGMLALSVAALEANPFPAHLDVVQFMMSYLGNAVPFTQRVALANSWLFGGMLKRKLAASHTTNASLRTTTAPTLFHAGVKENVLPAEAEAVVNFRIFPGDTLRDVYESVVDLVGDEHITVSPVGSETLESDYGWNPTPVVDTESPQFERLLNLVEAAFPEALAAPFLVLGATDARHYARICENAFRFSPVLITKEDLGGTHGVNEHLSFENAACMVGFYIECMREMGSLSTDIERQVLVEEIETKVPVEEVELPVYEPEKVEEEAQAVIKTRPAPKKRKPAKSDILLPDLPPEEELVVKPLKKE